MDNLSSQIEKAKKAGYSEQEIVDFISKDKELGPQIQQAVKAGYQPKEIIDHISQPPSLADTSSKYSAGSGIANLLDMPGRGVVAAGNLVRMGTGYLGNKFGLLKAEQMPEPIDPELLSFANPAFRKMGLIDDRYAPRDTGGKVVDFATQAVTGGGLNPAALARNAVRGAIKPIARDVIATTASGAGAGIGDAFGENVHTGNKSVDNTARIAATLIGGMVPGGVIAARGTAGDRAAAAANGITSEQWDAARRVKRLAAELGSPITDYEAAQAVTGLNPKMQTQQRLAEQSDAAAKTLTPMMQNRPSANSVVFNKTADSISPLEQFPDTLAGSLQRAAKDSITKQRQAGNAEAKPFYDSARVKQLSPAQESATVLDPAISMAIDKVVKDPLSSVYGMPKNTVAVIDAAKKHLDDIKNSAATKGQNNLSANAGGAAKTAAEIGDAAAPEYATARAIVEKNMRENVNPMEDSQIGKLSRSDDFKQQSAAFLPDAPADVTPSVVARTAETIGAQDPDIIKRFLAQDLRRKFAEANQRNVGGENAFGGSKFAANVAGNADQEANLLAAIKASGAPTAPFSDAMDVFRAQGYKPPVNSATVANASEASSLGGALGGLMSPFSAIPKAIDKWRNGMATSELAKAIAAQDSSGPLRIEELARANGTYDPVKQQMLINLLLGNQSPDQ